MGVGGAMVGMGGPVVGMGGPVVGGGGAWVGMGGAGGVEESWMGCGVGSCLSVTMI